MISKAVLVVLALTVAVIECYTTRFHTLAYRAVTSRHSSPYDTSNSSNNKKKLPKWAIREDEETVVIGEDEDFIQASIIDESIKSMESNNDLMSSIDSNKGIIKASTATTTTTTAISSSGKPDDQYSIASLTLRELSEATSFSLEFLGDFAVQLGCTYPINVNERIGNIMTGIQIFELLQAVNTLDPYDADTGYDAISIKDLAYDLDISIDRIISIIEKEKFNLPYGVKTVLHKSVIDRIKLVVENDEYNDEHLFGGSINGDDEDNDNHDSDDEDDV